MPLPHHNERSWRNQPGICSEANGSAEEVAEGAHYYSGADAGGCRARTVSELSTRREEGLGVREEAQDLCGSG